MQILRELLMLFSLKIKTSKVVMHYQIYKTCFYVFHQNYHSHVLLRL